MIINLDSSKYNHRRQVVVENFTEVNNGDTCAERTLKGQELNAHTYVFIYLTNTFFIHLQLFKQTRQHYSLLFSSSRSWMFLAVSRPPQPDHDTFLRNPCNPKCTRQGPGRIVCCDLSHCDVRRELNEPQKNRSIHTV